MLHRRLLAVVTLASAMTAFSDSALPVGAPMFEIDGRMVAAEVVRWESSGENRELGSGIVESVESGVLRDFPSARLTRRIRRAGESPVMRFRYELEAVKPEGFALTKSGGRDALVYATLDLSEFPRRTEVRLSDYDPLVHCHRPSERRIRDSAFEEGLSAVGPIVVAVNGRETLLLAYEHGSMSSDPFVEFAFSKAGRVELRAVKGNYWSGRRVTPGNPYVTIWLDFARVEGDEDVMASAFRDFQLRGVAPHSASRKPWIFYNTWASQERDHWWGGSRRFLNLMGEKRILEDIDRAAEMGIDVFVIDTGWYEKTGDWRVSTERFPHGFKPVTDRLAEHGMKLGLWFSPTEAAESSDIATRNRRCVVSRGGVPSELHSVWETEPSRCYCLASEYWKAAADEMMRCHRELGVTYFKWDAICQYGCDSPDHMHGDASVSAQERADCYAFEQVRYMARIVERLSEACPDAIVDFDVTEGWRSFGLAFLSAGKYFAVNNGPYFPDLDHPYDWSKSDYWSNVFVYPGPARPRIARATLDFDRWVPSVLFLTHYLPDGPRESQLVNLGSLVLGQNGIWGDLSVLTDDDRRFFREGLDAYKRVRDAITAAPPVRDGPLGGSPEVHEKLSADGRGAVVVFSYGGSCDYVTEHPAGKPVWTAGSVSVSPAGGGRARLHCEFPRASAAIVFFDR